VNPAVTVGGRSYRDASDHRLIAELRVPGLLFLSQMINKYRKET
jgi:hypothetical protein